MALFSTTPENYFSVSISRITNEFGFTGGRRLVAVGAVSYSAVVRYR
jgi:hypothetical protein